jgi:hypothetical protein
MEHTMGKHLPEQRPTVRYVAYPDVARRQSDAQLWQALAVAQATGRAALDVETAALVQRRVAQIAAREEQQRRDYQRWLERRMEIDRADRRTRSVLLGVGAVIGLGVLGGAGYAVWAVYSAVTAVALAPLLGVVGVIALGAVVVPLGRRCITVVNHWHE